VRALFLCACLGALTPAWAQGGSSPRQLGEALRERLAAEGVQASRSGRVRLAVRLGEADVGSLVLTTRVAQREDGTTVYRLLDTLRVDMPGVGSLHMNVEADLLADLSPVEVVLNTEEPRGVGVISRQRVVLRRRDGRWVREVVKGEAAPVVTPLSELGDDALVLTPPLGAGERLARWAEPVLGRRLSLSGHDLETGEGASWRLSVEEPRDVQLGDQATPAVTVLRREGAAQLESWFGLGGGEPLLLRLGERLRAVSWKLQEEPTLSLTSPAGVVARLLRALGRADEAALTELLDLDALAESAGGDDPAQTQAAVLRLLRERDWGSGRGLALQAVQSADLVSEESGDERFRVYPRGAPELRFEVARRGEALRVVGLPR
jgi:hypothetical protein